LVVSNLAPDIRVKYWKIQLDLFGYLAATAFIASTLSKLDQIHTFRSFILHTLINLSAFTGLYYFWRLSALMVYRRGKAGLTLYQIMGIGFMGGVIFTLCERAVDWIVQFPPTSNFFIQLLGFSLPAAFWLPAGSVISDNYRSYLQLKKSIQVEMLQQESVKLARSRALEEYRVKLEGQIQESLRVTTNEAALLFASLKERDIENLPEQLRVISGEYFRLTAHNMLEQTASQESWFEKSRRITQRLAETLRESVQARPLNPLWYATMVAVTAIPPILLKPNLVLAVEMIVVIFIASYIIQVTQLRIAQYYKVNLIRLAIISILLNIVIPLALVRSLPTNNPEQLYPVGFIILILSINFLGHLAQAGLLKGEDIQARTSASVEKIIEQEKQASSTFVDITRNWAQYIHGSFTSKLESSALALETALRENDFAEVEKAIAEVVSFLRSENIAQPMPQDVLLDEINERCKNWNSLIEFDIQANINREDIVGVSIQQVGSCIEEAILNASRHGNCTWIGIEILNTDTLFSIIFKDNGSGFTSHNQGFGSQIFTEATHGQWDLWRDERRQFTVLHLNFRKIH
jgi:signal transduction histidine kinase